MFSPARLYPTVGVITGGITSLLCGVEAAKRRMVNSNLHEHVDVPDVVGAGVVGCIMPGGPIGLIVGATWPISLPIIGVTTIASKYDFKNPYFVGRKKD
jgi:hypothetical protein